MSAFDLIKRLEKTKTDANQGNAQAQYDLGYMHEEGRGIKQDSAKAMQWYQMAAEQGHTKAQYELGLMYAKLPANKKNEEESVKWIQMAAEGFRQAAEQGDAEAQCRLGEIYGLVKGANQNRKSKMIATALGFYSGEKEAKWFEEESARWFQMATDVFRQAAEQGDVKAQFELAGIYCWFLGGKENEEKGVQWFLKAAEQGHAEAQYELGYMYSTGWGVPWADANEALKWYEKAAEQGNSLADAQIARIYAGVDELIEPDYAKALKWYLKLAEQNDLNAQYNVGILYAKGLGTEQNLAEAKKWLKKTVASGHTDAKKALELIESFQNPQENALDEITLDSLKLVF
ncbi:MAG: SEL1-like repeat protein [Azoarcus sp.]|jgi:TPR repeat protein|nr:SEL1-like repeat protein [Azoarcus sp.]